MPSTSANKKLSANDGATSVRTNVKAHCKVMRRNASKVSDNPFYQEGYKRAVLEMLVFVSYMDERATDTPGGTGR